MLDCITRGEPVNIQSCAKQLIEANACYLEDIQKLFAYKPEFQGKQLIGILDRTAFEQLRLRFPIDATANRISAALAGDSHRTGLSGCFAIMDSLSEDAATVCRVLGEHISVTRPFGEQLVVVENEELMLQKPLLRRLLLEHTHITRPEGVDLLLGSGTRASSRFYGTIYRKYQQIHFLLDLDLGGFKAFKSALGLMGSEQSAHFLLPDVIEQILKSYTERHGKTKFTPKQVANLEKYKGIHPDLDYAIGLVYKYRSMPEQEVYLALMESFVYG